MEAFATVDDLQAGWRTLTETEAARAEVLLERASVSLYAICLNHNIIIDEYDELQAEILKNICCNMVMRAISQNDDLINATSHTQTAGSYSETISFSDPASECYPKRNELKDLGIFHQRKYDVHPVIGGDYRDCW